jgi:hypothetical protein
MPQSALPRPDLDQSGTRRGRKINLKVQGWSFAGFQMGW